MSSFNIFGSQNMSLPLESCGPVYESEYTPDPVKNQEASVETMNVYDLTERAELAKTMLSGKNMFNLADCAEDCCGGPRKKPITFTKTVCKETGKTCWEFFLSQVRFTVINDFITKLAQVKEEDCVMIHGPGSCFHDDAEVVYSAIKACKAKEKWISEPYIMNTPGAFILMAGTKIIPSVCNVMRITTPSVGGSGSVQDTTNCINSSIFRYTKMLKTLEAEGFITEEEVASIVNDQKSICLHGQRLAQAIAAFNQRHA